MVAVRQSSRADCSARVAFLHKDNCPACCVVTRGKSSPELSPNSRVACSRFSSCQDRSGCRGSYYHRCREAAGPVFPSRCISSGPVSQARRKTFALRIYASVPNLASNICHAFPTHIPKLGGHITCRHNGIRSFTPPCKLPQHPLLHPQSAAHGVHRSGD